MSKLPSCHPHFNKDYFLETTSRNWLVLLVLEEKFARSPPYFVIRQGCELFAMLAVFERTLKSSISPLSNTKPRKGTYK
jgi:hypothetical protein